MTSTSSISPQNRCYCTMLVLILCTVCGLILYSSWFNKWPGIRQQPSAYYDYVVVGAGTAGCVMAARLSSDPGISVLLVEAGGLPAWLSTVPLAAPFLQGRYSSHDWSYQTQPQKHSSWGLRGRISAWPRGKGLGGSGQLNYMVHSTGHPEDFQLWAEDGATGWSYKDMKPYLDKLEKGCEPNRNDENFWHKNDPGCDVPTVEAEKPYFPLQTIDVQEIPLAKAFLNAGHQLRRSGEALKFDLIRSTIHKGQRWSSLEGFLKPSLFRQNLHVLINSPVRKLIVEDRRVTGVQFHSGINVSTLQEVILCAGAINTPLILHLSGIGPQNHLHNLGIPVVADLPVGLNLHDHMNMPLYVSITSPVSLTIDKIKSIKEVWNYLAHGKGIFASSAVIGTASTRDSSVMLFGLGSADENILRDVANYKGDTFQQLFPLSQNSSQEGFILLASCLRPQSRGAVQLNKTAPAEEPIIDPNYLSHPYDVNCMIQGIHMAEKIVKTNAFQLLGAQLHLPNLSECKHLVPDIKDTLYLECITRTAAVTGYHPGGTCKMGSPQDSSTVLDPLLRVHGVQGLRVVDASILPTPISGHPNSVIIAVADRAASLILK